MKTMLPLFALLSACMALAAVAAPHVRVAQLQGRLGATANVSNGVKPVAATPDWEDIKTTTFWVTGAGDPELNGCYAHSFSQSNPPSVMYAKMSTHESFLNFGPAHQCSVEAQQDNKVDALGRRNSNRFWELCDPARIGWFLSKLKCLEPACRMTTQVDVYFMQAAVAKGKIPKPLSTSDSKWQCRPEIRKKYPHNSYGDCVNPIPKVEMRRCDPLNDKPKRPAASALPLSAANLAAPGAALLLAVAAALPA